MEHSIVFLLEKSNKIELYFWNYTHVEYSKIFYTTKMFQGQLKKILEFNRAEVIMENKDEECSRIYPMNHYSNIRE